jgi:alkylhydroperoxidase family enzyme
LTSIASAWKGVNRAVLEGTPVMTTILRVPPLPADQWSEDQRAILDADLGPDPPLGSARLGDVALFTTVARHERAFSAWLVFGRELVLRAALSFADRELLILRTAWNCRSDYEWGQHVRIATRGGVERALVDRVPAGPGADGWSRRQALLLSAADELHVTARITDHTWAGLREYLGETELIELPMLVGYYRLVAGMVGALAVQPETGLDPLPAG